MDSGEALLEIDPAMAVVMAGGDEKILWDLHEFGLAFSDYAEQSLGFLGMGKDKKEGRKRSFRGCRQSCDPRELISGYDIQSIVVVAAAREDVELLQDLADFGWDLSRLAEKAWNAVKGDERVPKKKRAKRRRQEERLNLNTPGQITAAASARRSTTPDQGDEDAESEGAFLNYSPPKKLRGSRESGQITVSASSEASDQEDEDTKSEATSYKKGTPQKPRRSTGHETDRETGGEAPAQTLQPAAMEGDAAAWKAKYDQAMKEAQRAAAWKAKYDEAMNEIRRLQGADTSSHALARSGKAMPSIGANRSSRGVDTSTKLPQRTALQKPGISGVDTPTPSVVHIPGTSEELSREPPVACQGLGAALVTPGKAPTQVSQPGSIKEAEENYEAEPSQPSKHNEVETDTDDQGDAMTGPSRACHDTGPGVDKQPSLLRPNDAKGLSAAETTACEPTLRGNENGENEAGSPEKQNEEDDDQLPSEQENVNHNSNMPLPNRRISLPKGALCTYLHTLAKKNGEVYWNLPGSIIRQPMLRALTEDFKSKYVCLDKAGIAITDHEHYSYKVSQQLYRWREKMARRKPCGICDSCKSGEDCGCCKYCLDKPKFGGRNKLRRRCIKLQCETW